MLLILSLDVGDGCGAVVHSSCVMIPWSVVSLKM